jgi:glycosyltransferase involved in cell wall biosynthesis
LQHDIHIPERKISHIYNGVDTQKFSSDESKNKNLSIDLPENFIPDNGIVFGTVGRLAEVKNQLFLIKSFLNLIQQYPELQKKARLILVGDGILMQPAKQLVTDFCSKNDCGKQFVFFSGKSDQASQYMRLMDIFVLPSLAEGISNTILEAMATSLPVIATDVGGNKDLVVENETGFIIPVDNIEALTQTMKIYLDTKELILVHGDAGRKRIEENFSMKKMVRKYEQVYQKVLN